MCVCSLTSYQTPTETKCRSKTRRGEGRDVFLSYLPMDTPLPIVMQEYKITLYAVHACSKRFHFSFFFFFFLLFAITNYNRFLHSHHFCNSIITTVNREGPLLSAELGKAPRQPSPLSTCWDLIQNPYEGNRV